MSRFPLGSKLDHQQTGLGPTTLATAQLNGVASPLLTNDASALPVASSMTPVAMGSLQPGAGGYIWDAPQTNFCTLDFVGTGADNATFGWQVVGWKQVVLPSDDPVWVPRLLLQSPGVGGRLSALTGNMFGTSIRFADDVTAGGTMADYTLNGAKLLPSVAAVNEVPRRIVFDPLGSQKIELRVLTDGLSTATATAIAGILSGV